MSILDRLASTLGRRDEVPNQELARRIIHENNQAATKELVTNLKNKNKSIQNDCIKVLYEIGEVRPEFIEPFVSEFLLLLQSRNNRLQWGGMIALDYICRISPKKVFAHLPHILKSAEQGSVITRDHCVRILVTLCDEKRYAATVFPHLINQLRTCPTNQLPMYAEQSLSIINETNKRGFVKVLNERINEIEKDSKRRRIEKVIQRLSV